MWVYQLEDASLYQREEATTCSDHENSNLGSVEQLPLTRWAGVLFNTVFLYDVRSMLLLTHPLSCDFGFGGSCIEIDANTLLCVGASPDSSAVFALDLSSFQLQSWPSLVTPRRDVGLAKVKTQFYVFGGHYGKTTLSSCEKMVLADQYWSEMNSMHYPRAAFTPCHFNSLLYLVSANIYAQRTIETFNADTHTFALLPISLPDSLIINVDSVAFVADGELCLLTNCKQMARWKIQTEREFRVLGTNRNIWSRQQPLIIGSFAFIAYKLKVLKFNLQTYSFDEESNSP